MMALYVLTHRKIVKTVLKDSKQKKQQLRRAKLAILLVTNLKAAFHTFLMKYEQQDGMKRVNWERMASGGCQVV